MQLPEEVKELRDQIIEFAKNRAQSDIKNKFPNFIIDFKESVEENPANSDNIPQPLSE